jgi:hypothetical protein
VYQSSVTDGGSGAVVNVRPKVHVLVSCSSDITSSHRAVLVSLR